MNLPEETVELFNDSLDRCIAHPSFLDDFYNRFTTASPQVAALFAATPMSRQKRLLKASLFTAMLAADGNPPAREQLIRLAQRHQELQIPPQLYDLWLSSLLAAARDCLGEIDESMETAWRDVLGVAIALVRGESEG